METEKQLAPGKFALNYGVILGVIVVLISVIMYVTGMTLDGVQWPMYIFYLIFLITIFYAVNQYKKQNSNLLSIGQAVKVGLVAGAISGLIAGLYILVFNYFIDPGFMDQMMEMQREKMMENPNMTEEMIDKSMGFMEIMQNPWLVTALSLAFYTFFGLIYSLIAGLIMKKQDPQL